MSRKLVVGDIHGGYRALEQVLDRANFDPSGDTLYAVGDYVDGWSESFEVIEFLRTLPNFCGVIGNHDVWWRCWLDYGATPRVWTQQGGRATLDSYEGVGGTLFDRHRKFARNLRDYMYVDVGDETHLIVHAGIPTRCSDEYVSRLSTEELTWDRSMWYACVGQSQHVGNTTEFVPHVDHTFIGHTSTMGLDVEEPWTICDVTNMDTGAGWHGKLSLLDMETFEFWQSDQVKLLYPGMDRR